MLLLLLIPRMVQQRGHAVWSTDAKNRLGDVISYSKRGEGALAKAQGTCPWRVDVGGKFSLGCMSPGCVTSASTPSRLRTVRLRLGFAALTVTALPDD